MATIKSQPIRWAIKYSAAMLSDSPTTRTVNGINVGGGGTSGTGALANTAITAIYNMLSGLSVGTITNLRWIYEREVEV